MDVQAVDMPDIVDEAIYNEFRFYRQVYARTDYFHFYSDELFRVRFRLSKETALHVLQQIEHRLEYLEDR